MATANSGLRTFYDKINFKQGRIIAKKVAKKEISKYLVKTVMNIIFQKGYP